jgi:hypothetical protein
MSEYEQVIDEIVKHGVVVKVDKIVDDNYVTGERRYVGCVVKLDFSEHDKVFEDRIAKKWELIDKLYKENVRLEEKCMKKDADIYNFQCENRALEQRIAELEIKETETCEKEPISDDCRPSMEWYENRHQSDCIEINRLNTTIDVLIHKVEYLRQFAGLE